MENQKIGSGWCKASIAFGVIAMIFALLPLISKWCLLFLSFNYVVAPVGIIFGVIALVKSQSLPKSIAGLVLCIGSLCAPFLYL